MRSRSTAAATSTRSGSWRTRLLAGVPPFTGSAFEIMRGHTTEQATPLGTYRPDLPPEMEAAVMRMLHKEPADRFAGFADALAAMGATAVAEGDPLRAELVRLAAVEERRTMLGSLLHTPSPSATPSGGTGRRSGGASAGASAGASGARAAATGAQTAVAIAPITSALEPGDSLQLHARVVGSDEGTAIRWSVDAPASGAVDAVTGAFTALSAGEGHVLATVGSVTERTPFTVVAARAAAVSVEPPAGSLSVGDVTRLVAHVTDRRGRSLERTMQWRAQGGAVTLAHSGSTYCTVECIAEGTTAVTASCDGVSGTVVLQVGAASKAAASTPAASRGAKLDATLVAPRTRSTRWYGVVALVVVVVAGAGAVAWRTLGTRAGEAGAGASATSLAADSMASGAALPGATVETDAATDAASNALPGSASDGAPSQSAAGVPAGAPEGARATGSSTAAVTPPPDRAGGQPPAVSATPATVATGAATGAPAEPSAAQRQEQMRLAREAREIIESFASAVETRQLARVRAVYPGLSSGNVETFDNMFRSTTAVRMRIGEISVVNGAPYDATVGSRTYLTADVTFELVPLGGGTIPPAEDILPVTLQRTASGWRLEQIGVP